MEDYIVHNGELYHYGVKGMKWGVRRKRQTQVASKSEKIKKNIKRGAVIAGVVLAAYGGYKVNQFLDSCSYTINGKSVSRKEFASTVDMIIKSLH